MARIHTYQEVQELAGDDILILTDASNLNATKTTNVDDLTTFIGNSAALNNLTDTYIYEQVTPASTWVIAHNLDKYPSVTIVDNYNRQFEGHVEYTDSNTITVALSATITGKAYLN